MTSFTSPVVDAASAAGTQVRLPVTDDVDAGRQLPPDGAGGGAACRSQTR